MRFLDVVKYHNREQLDELSVNEDNNDTDNKVLSH